MSLLQKRKKTMRSIRITDIHSPFYPAFQRTNKASFPENERRSDMAQAMALANPRYRLDAWLDNDIFIGFMGWWDYGDYRYIEHVAVTPEARSVGYGGKMLAAWLDKSPTPVYLEIEEVVDDITRRRLNFYQRLGFVETPMRHQQPPYQGRGGTVPMQVLSWPDALSSKQYQSLIRALHAEVWAGLPAA